MQKEPVIKNWSFFKEGATEKEIVDIPHDAMLFEKRYAGNSSEGACANFDGGLYHYEKHFQLSEEDKEKYLAVYFEGVYRNASVYFNGQYVGGCKYGYSSFLVELDVSLRLDGENVLEVVADNSKTPNSRWYTGSGIYRPVWLIKGEKSHICWQGVQVSTLSIDTPKIHIAVKHTGKENSQVIISIEKDGKEVAAGQGDNCDIEIPEAQLWSAENPCTYDCRVQLLDDGQVVDEALESFGIRKISYSSKGLLVNGKNTKLKGGCIHADNGILGAKSYKASEWRRVKKLKEMGFNAIRCSHNPAAEELLKACDFYGLYVMDESWDMWFNHKNHFDYASDFEENWEFDLESMVKKDFNHPSVIMYSIGNEISEPASEKGMEYAEKIIDKLHALDSGRPVTGGMNLMILTRAAAGKGIYKEDGSGADTSTSVNSSMMFNIMTSMVGSSMNKAANSKKADAITSPILDALDIAGYNYASGRYEMEGSLHPNRVIFGSETFINDLPKNWAMVEKFPWLIGDFMWTAWDYLGEAGAGAWAYTKDGIGFEKPYPWILADMGVLDILGNFTGQAFMAEAVWGNLKTPKIAVRPVNKEGRPAKSSWRGTDSIPSWSWKDCQGKKAIIEVFTDANTVELSLNGKSLGKKKVKDFKATFKTNYLPGTLEAKAYDSSGKLLGVDKLISARGKEEIAIETEKTEYESADLIYCNISIVGENGEIESNADRKFAVTVTGGKLLGFGSANPRTEESFVTGEYTSYYGKAQAIILPEDEKVTINVNAADLSASAVLNIKNL